MAIPLPRFAVSTLAVAALGLALAGCESANTVTSGGTTAPPDAIAYRTPPLSLPPDYGVRPSRTGKGDATERLARKRGGAAPAPEAPAPAPLAGRVSRGTAALLRQTGAPEAAPDIRQTITRETTILAHENAAFVDRLVLGTGTAAEGGPQIVLKRSQSRLLPF